MTSPEGGDPFEGGLSLSVTASEVSSLWAWLMAGFGMIALGAAIIGQLLPGVLGLDLLAMWPVPALAVLVTLVAAVFRSRGFLRIIGPLLLMTWLVLGVGWFLTGSLEPPSRAADVVGTDSIPDTVALGVLSTGDVVIGQGVGPETYRIGLIDRGGSTGVPDVLEASENGAMAMTIGERRDSGWYRTAGWDILLHSTPTWSLDVTAANVELDLSGLMLSQLAVEGDGALILGPPNGPVIVDLQGDLVVSVPSGSPVVVVGGGDVPIAWTETADGSQSTTDGEGYVITVRGGPGITIVER